MLPRRKTKIQLHSVTVSSAGAEFLYHQWPNLFADTPIQRVRQALRRREIALIQTPLNTANGRKTFSRLQIRSKPARCLALSCRSKTSGWTATCASIYP
ncbi:hypothetical protein PMA4326_019575 [Pseudomonas syringae pv. maculicola str. ES4326]|uniref:Uncharacterized protein n=1 Tax=Pseudomonas syringae pv. maculicola str. ES4326 TaxID=629265 RepID=A0A8T8C5Q3_PSEYM|nr:hypothetical protein PMA4326_019575 [Pseudomonas syringae pv. maculicola str. ES4326]